mmetsp:Transcript_16843/g.35736  ORF Transcript_16843/g.35736 Transcript_16843/m.35736 type:complete len:238 (-) Transcript_16843:173-886(-)
MSSWCSVAESPLNVEKLAAERSEHGLELLHLRWGRVDFKAQQLGRTVQHSLQYRVHILEVLQKAIRVSVRLPAGGSVSAEAKGILMRFFFGSSCNRSRVRVLPHFLERLLVFQAEIRVNVADGVLSHCRVACPEPPLSRIENTAKRSERFNQFVDLRLGTVHLQPLKLCDFRVENALQRFISICQVLQNRLGVRIRFPAVGPCIVIREAKCIVHAVILVLKGSIISLPDLLEGLCIL